MNQITGLGFGKGMDGKEAVRQAVQTALDQLGSAQPVVALVWFTLEFDGDEILKTLINYLGNIPFWGSSANLLFDGEKEYNRSVAVLLLGSSDIRAQVAWYPDLIRDSDGTSRQFIRMLQSLSPRPQGIIVAADGFSSHVQQVCKPLAVAEMSVSGYLASGDVHDAQTCCLGGNQSGVGALSALLLGGRLRIGTGLGFGWVDSGVEFLVTRTEGALLRELDHTSPMAAYSKIFGDYGDGWQDMPELVRLYPLGVEMNLAGGNLMVRSPLFVESDGSFLLNAPLQEDQKVHLMIGNSQACLDAMQLACEQALHGLGNAEPVVALVWMDWAWHYLLDTKLPSVLAKMDEALKHIPVVGAYTLGQVARPAPGNIPQVFNQTLMVVVIGAVS